MASRNRLANARLLQTRNERGRLSAASTLAKAKLAAADKTSEAKLTAASKLADAKLKAFDGRTAAQKEYDQGVKEGFKGDLKEWKEGTVREKRVYDEYVASSVIAKSKVEPFHKWLPDWRKSGATQITVGEKLDVKAKKYFTDPKGLVSDVEKYVGSKTAQNQLFRYSGDPVKHDQETVRMKEQYIRNKIIGSNGKILNAKLEGRTFVFTVEWFDGSVSEVRYAN